MQDSLSRKASIRQPTLQSISKSAMSKNATSFYDDIAKKISTVGSNYSFSSSDN